MAHILTIQCIRIKEDLEQYKMTGVIPEELHAGNYTIHDIKSCYKEFDPETQRVSDLLIKRYASIKKNEIAILKHNLRKEYIEVISSLETNKNEFMFPTILGQYRPEINSVRALYYETRSMLRNFDPKSEYHVWLLSVIQEPGFIKSILSALVNDSKRLQAIVKKYNTPLLTKGNHIPLELFHAKREINDFKHYYYFFKIAKDWTPN